MEYEIEFYSLTDPHNRAIMDIPDDMTTHQIKVISDLQREAGRTESKIRSGYPVYCPACGIRTGLRPIPYSHILCRSCAASMMQNETVKAISLKQRREGIPG